jgi:hypothetical protein
VRSSPGSGRRSGRKSGSDWFLKARHYVDQSGAPWFILSAEYGLVPPDQVISPYERTLNTMPVLARSAMRTLRPLLGRTAIARTVLIGFLIGGFCGQANSQSNPATPVDEFAQEYKKLKDSLASLPKRIEDTGRSVDQNTNPESAKTQIDALRA